jgi:hypothetical protein
MRRTIPPLVALLAACASAVTKSPSATPGIDASSPQNDAGAVTGAPDDAGAVTGPPDGGTEVFDAAEGAEAGADAGIADGGTPCAWGGAPGECITVSACAALADHTSFAGQCPGPAAVECCITTPSVADDPPLPAGYKLMAQAQVTSEMTAWAVAILNDPVTYPMFSATLKTFGAQAVLARVEWHPPDFQNSAVHRGVTLYVPG